MSLFWPHNNIKGACELNRTVLTVFKCFPDIFEPIHLKNAFVTLFQEFIYKKIFGDNINFDDSM